MARFLFHLHEQEGVTADLEGKEMPSGAEARAHATRGARSILSHGILEGCLNLEGHIQVVNSQTGEEFDIRFMDVLNICYPSESGTRPH